MQGLCTAYGGVIDENRYAYLRVSDTRRGGVETRNIHAISCRRVIDRIPERHAPIAIYALLLTDWRGANIVDVPVTVVVDAIACFLSCQVCSAACAPRRPASAAGDTSPFSMALGACPSAAGLGNFCNAVINNSIAVIVQSIAGFCCGHNLPLTKSPITGGAFLGAAVTDSHIPRRGEPVVARLRRYMHSTVVACAPIPRVLARLGGRTWGGAAAGRRCSGSITFALYAFSSVALPSSAFVAGLSYHHIGQCAAPAADVLDPRANWCERRVFARTSHAGGWRVAYVPRRGIADHWGGTAANSSL